MSLNVSYEGIHLSEGTFVRPTDQGLFLPLPAPMPVGTCLVLERSGLGGRQAVRVTRVQEGERPGVYVVADGAVVFPLVVEEESAAPELVDPEVTAPSPPPHTVTAVTAAPASAAAPAGPSATPSVSDPVPVPVPVPVIVQDTAPELEATPVVAGVADAEGEDDTVVTATNGVDKPDAGGEPGARKARRAKRGGGKR